jgi:hypothetical protein
MNTTTEIKMSAKALEIFTAADTYTEWWKEAELEAKAAAFQTWAWLTNGNQSKIEYAEIFAGFEKLAQSKDPKQALFGQVYINTLTTLSEI